MRLGTLVHNTTLMSKPHLQVCKQQQIASGIRNLLTNVYAYNLVVLVFLTMRLGTLAHNTTLMSKPRLQVCKQQQIASGIKNFKTNVYGHNLVGFAFLPVRLGTLVHNTTLKSNPRSLMSKPTLQQQQTASGVNLHFCLSLGSPTMTPGTMVHHNHLMPNLHFCQCDGALVHHIAIIATNELPQGILL